MSITPLPSISIIGSTGGTGIALLRHCLRASLHVNVLVRSPEKLLALLSFTTAPPNLTIIPGSIQDAAAVKRSLLTTSGNLVDIIVSFIGFLPSMTEKGFSLNPFSHVEDLSLCRNAAEIVLSTIKDLGAEGCHTANSIKAEDKVVARSRPLFVSLSSTGISKVGRDIPITMVPLYHWMLSTPHKDKAAMEDFLRATPQEEQRWTIIRPSLFMGDGKGEFSGENQQKRRRVRVGIERNGKMEKREIGYTIRREDVGTWIFENIVQKLGNGAEEWEGAAVSLTE